MISIQLQSKTALYQQIKDNIIFYINKGIYQPHDLLPSIRQLATDLTINPNTVSKAFRELELEGYIYTVVGKGSFVSDNLEIQKLNRLAAIQEFKSALKNSLSAGLTLEELNEIMIGEKPC